MFGSSNKGLFVYAPVLILAVFAVPRALCGHRALTVFALLAVGSTAAELAILRVVGDETWGLRYMHFAVAPLLVVIGAVRSRFHWRQDVPLLALAAIGAAISFLGAIYYYGVMHFASMKAGQNTVEWLVGDPVWNHVRFNAKLFQVWLGGGRKPVPWTATHTWMYSAPSDAQAWKSIDLREFCEPQSLMLRLWHAPKQGAALGYFSFYLSALVVGGLAMAAAILGTVKEMKPPPAEAATAPAAPSQSTATVAGASSDAG
jgi:hypothetical protein